MSGNRPSSRRENTDPRDRVGEVPAGRDETERGEAHRDERGSSIGAYLAGQRRLRGISIEELSQRTRIPRRNIERLEAGAFDAAADGFTRGFVRTVAGALGLDPDEAVMRLMCEPSLDDSSAASGRLAPSGRLLLGLALVLVTTAAGLALWRLASQPSAPAPTASVPESSRPHSEPTPADPRRDLVFRRDSIRELAEERAAPAPGLVTEAAEAPPSEVARGPRRATAGAEPRARR